jgi:hypothetical protein
MYERVRSAHCQDVPGKAGPNKKVFETMKELKPGSSRSNRLPIALLSRVFWNSHLPEVHATLVKRSETSSAGQ